jgi:hypothetical protein
LSGALGTENPSNKTGMTLVAAAGAAGAPSSDQNGGSSA